MSDIDDSARNFLQRWSQRKRAAEKHTSDNAALSPGGKDADANVGAQRDADPPAFDLTTLPPIESITAASDIGAFLAPGVPEELTRAALRRVWVTDPTIRDFVGIAENQWDFTKVDGVPGFGSLELTPGLLRMVASLIGGAAGQADERQANAEQAQQTAEKSGHQPPFARTSAPGEDNKKVERPRPRSELITSTGPVRVIEQDSDQDNANDVLVGTRSIYRKHGSAVPK